MKNLKQIRNMKRSPKLRSNLRLRKRKLPRKCMIPKMRMRMTRKMMKRRRPSPRDRQAGRGLRRLRRLDRKGSRRPPFCKRGGRRGQRSRRRSGRIRGRGNLRTTRIESPGRCQGKERQRGGGNLRGRNSIPNSPTKMMKILPKQMRSIIPILLRKSYTKKPSLLKRLWRTPLPNIKHRRPRMTKSLPPKHTMHTSLIVHQRLKRPTKMKSF
eukprot:32125_3